MDNSESSLGPERLTDGWCAHTFDYKAHQLGQDLHATLARMRREFPVAHSSRYGGYTVFTRYEDVLRIAQDWKTFSSERGITPGAVNVQKAIPETIDPPLHREYKRLINAWFTPAVISQYEQPTRRLVNRLIDEFIDAGSCEFMDAFALPLPGLSFFELILNTPSDQLAELSGYTRVLSIPGNPETMAAIGGLMKWIAALVAQRRSQPRLDDVVDAIMHAEIEGRPITDDEIRGIILLLLLGGLDTTAGALGQFMVRFCEHPEIPQMLRDNPAVIPVAVEELLRLDPPFVAIGRTVTCPVDIGGVNLDEDDKVMIYWASANRDETEFPRPDEFDLTRPTNRHMSFGVGPHRCAGSHLARQTLRVALEELMARLTDLRFQSGAEPIEYHSALNRVPLAVPVAFTKGSR